jgi:phytoene synthase
MTAGEARQARARRLLRRHARSFSWAARLLPARVRSDATLLYAWCRRCDDAIDLAADPDTARAAAERLRRELDAVCGDGPLAHPVLAGMREVLAHNRIPRRYADELLDGMAMDVGRVHYARVDDLLVYCYRVAGTVGIMMAHIMGVREGAALRHATDLGIAMQLTNICRDVAEDERHDRVYLPAELLRSDLRPTEAGARAAEAVAALLRLADDHYRSGDEGLPALPAACAAAVRAARLIYAEIGAVIARHRFDVRRGRAIVSPWRKLWLVLRALAGTAAARLAAPPRALLRGAP